MRCKSSSIATAFSRQKPGSGFVRITASALVLFSSNLAFAQSDTERIAALEARIARLEALLAEKNGQKPKKKASKEQKPQQTAEESHNPAVVPARALNRAAEEQDEFAQQAFIYRDNIPTLARNRAEISTQLNYGRNEGFLQNDRSVSSVTSFRYGLANEFEVSVTVPAYWTSRETLGGESVIENSVTSLGDISAGISKVLWDQTASYPGASLSTIVNFPTGSSPFVFGDNYVIGSNPTDVFSNFLSTGMWAVSGNIQLFKTVDPLILFFGGGVNYTFGDDIEGHSVQPLPSVNLNAGFSFALSEKTTLSASVTYVFSDGLEVDGVRIGQSDDEIAIGQLLLVQRLGDNLYLEPSVAGGLTSNAQDFSFGLALRKRL